MTITIQETSKKFKLQILLSSMLFWVGFFWLIFAVFSDTTINIFSKPAILMSVGLVWYLITKFMTWWHHK